jgi:vitamin B12/bleomycin/antimicrobial peptide transport system ATP-binding/permease protein
MQFGTPESGNRRALVGRYWRTARGFWGGQARKVAWLLTGSLLVIVFAQLYVQYRINLWNRDIFNAIEKRDASIVFAQALIFIPLALASIGLAVGAVYARMRAQRRWRAWLNDELVDCWLHKGQYYQLNFVAGDHENPEGRIAEDARVATDAPIDFAVGILSAVLTAALFIGVLAGVGGSLQLGEHVIPSYLVIAVVLYALTTSSAMILIARSFVPVSERRNQAEAEYRYARTRLRENGESIALLGGEEEEREGLRQKLRNVIGAWAKLGGQYMRTTLVSNGNYVLAPVIPIILCAPKYLAGAMKLGDVMQAAAAFVQVQASFNWLVDNYPRLADWAASARRVASFLVSLDRLAGVEKRGFGRIERVEHDGKAIRLSNVSVALSDGTVVVNDAEVDIDFGERVLFMGESGSGKSTLVRAIAGLWPWGHGRISIAHGARLFLMPQRPYIPLGTLRHAATYPQSEHEVDDATLAQTLEIAGLAHLVKSLDEQDVAWDHRLSGGEQQRLAFVRLLLQKPNIVIMDEATSALDPPSQAHLMEELFKALPKMAVLSVGHRPELEEFHQRKVMLKRKKGGARLISDEPLVPAMGLASVVLNRWRRPLPPVAEQPQTVETSTTLPRRS